MTGFELVFDAPPGGVQAKTVGAMTGRLKLRLNTGKRGLIAEIAYDETDEWWQVVGGHVPDGATLEQVAGWLARDLGLDENENARVTTLRGMKL